MTTGSEPVVSAAARRAEFRRLMIATVDAHSPSPRRRRVVFATVAAALFIVGVLTGGALVASSNVLARSPDSWWNSAPAREAVLQGISGGSLIGTTKIRTHNGTTTVDLGSQPKSANALAISIPCQQSASGRVLIDGGAGADATYRCAGSEGSVSELYLLDRTTWHRLTVTASKQTKVVVTWGWAKSTRSSELLKVEQELRQSEQAYEQGLAQCAAAALSGVECPTATPVP